MVTEKSSGIQCGMIARILVSVGMLCVFLLCTMACEKPDPGGDNGTKPGTTTTTMKAPVLSGPTYTVEPGIRVDYAGNAKASYNSDPAVGQIGTYLYYEDKSDTSRAGEGGGLPGAYYAFSEYGLKFGEPQSVEIIPGACADGKNATVYTAHAARQKLPDGSGWRMYFLNFLRDEEGVPRFTALASSFSSDCEQFCEEDGSRYELGPNDDDTMGVYTTFTAEHSSEPQVVLLYLGNLFGDNNARRAVAGGDGYDFDWERDNVLNDATGRSSDAYVDIATVPTNTPGKRRLYSMQQGTDIYSFVTEDDGKTFKQEDGVRVNARDFDSAVADNEYICMLFDPSIAVYTDDNGTITSTRMYVTGRVWDSTRTWEHNGESGSCADVEICNSDVRYENCNSRETLLSAVSYDD